MGCVRGVRMERAWGTCMELAWGVRGACVGSVWSASGAPAWSVRGVRIARAWGTCMERVWGARGGGVHGACMERAWGACAAANQVSRVFLFHVSAHHVPPGVCGLYSNY